jgi:hypothetical protein
MLLVVHASSRVTMCMVEAVVRKVSVLEGTKREQKSRQRKNGAVTLRVMQDAARVLSTDMADV